MTPQQEQKISEYATLIHRFIHIATGGQFPAIKLKVNDRYPFSYFFDWTIKNAADYQQGFFEALRYIPDDSLKMWEKNIRLMLPMLDYYLNWYLEHENEVKDFEPYNPYRVMNDNMEYTKAIILSLFPYPATPGDEKKKINQEQLDSLTLENVVKPDFKIFLNDTGKALLPGIHEIYKGRKKIEYSYLILALNDLNMLAISLQELWDKRQISAIHEVLISEFGKVGTLQNLQGHFIKGGCLRKADPVKLAEHKDRLQKLAINLQIISK